MDVVDVAVGEARDARAAAVVVADLVAVVEVAGVADVDRAAGGNRRRRRLEPRVVRLNRVGPGRDGDRVAAAGGVHLREVADPRARLLRDDGDGDRSADGCAAAAADVAGDDVEVEPLVRGHTDAAAGDDRLAVTRARAVVDERLRLDVDDRDGGLDVDGRGAAEPAAD